MKGVHCKFADANTETSLSSLVDINLLKIFYEPRRSVSVNKLNRATTKNANWSDSRQATNLSTCCWAIKRISNDPQIHQRLQRTNKTNFALSAWSQRKINCTVAKIIAQNCACSLYLLKYVAKPQMVLSYYLFERVDQK